MTPRLDVMPVPVNGNGRLLKIASWVIALLVGIVLTLVGAIARGNTETVATQATEISVLRAADSDHLVKITALEQQQREDERFRTEMREQLREVQKKLDELVGRARRGGAE